MDKHALYHLWAPPESIWSPWVKPAPFAHLAGEVRPTSPLAPTEFDLGRVPGPHERFAVVIDLSGPLAVAVAIALAERGYRPVSLFNACPPKPIYDLSEGPPVFSAVDVNAQLRALASSAEKLKSIALSPDAPPAFLIEAGRAAEAKMLWAKTWNNRSIVFAADFPSTLFLRKQKITRALWIHCGSKPMGSDLQQALGFWQKEHAEIFQLDLATAQSMEPLRVRAPSLIEALRQRFRSLGSLHHHPQGGYGGFVPDPSSG